VRPGARWLPERITGALAAFAVTASPPAAGAAGSEQTATSAPYPPPAEAAVTDPRRPGWQRRGLLVPAAAAVAIVAAVGIALAATSAGGTGQPNAFNGRPPTVSASPVAATSRPETQALGSPRPATSKPARPTKAASHKAVAKRPATPAQPTPSEVIVTETATTRAPAPRPSSAPARPTPAPSPTGAACAFIVNGAVSCGSTNPTVSLWAYFSDDTSACSFTRDITWGDGTSSTVVVQGGPAGPKYVTSHTFAAPGTYSIYFGSESIQGSCTDAVLTYTFQLLPS
jgi:hypothetical protein